MQLVEKNKLIEQLKAQVAGGETEKQLAISEAINKKEHERELALGKKNDELADKEKKIASLIAQIENGKNERKLAITEAVNVKEKEIAQKIEEINKLKEAFSAKERAKDREIEQLKSQIEGSETVKKLAISEAINKKDIEKQNMSKIGG